MLFRSLEAQLAQARKEADEAKEKAEKAEEAKQAAEAALKAAKEELERLKNEARALKKGDTEEVAGSGRRYRRQPDCRCRGGFRRQSHNDFDGTPQRHRPLS